MDINNYIGYRLNEVKLIFKENNIDYIIKEVFDTKETKLGDDCRVINIKTINGKTILYVSYF